MLSPVSKMVITREKSICAMAPTQGWVAPAPVWVMGLLVALFMALFIQPVMAQEDPGIPRLELKFERPRQITVFGGKGNDLRPDGVPSAGRTYWYLPYTLENKSGLDSTFHVGFRASSDKKRTYCDIALPWVEKLVERREGKSLFSRGDLLKKNGAADLGMAISGKSKDH